MRKGHPVGPGQQAKFFYDTADWDEGEIASYDGLDATGDSDTVSLEDADSQESGDQKGEGQDNTETSSWLGQADPMFMGDGSDYKEKFDYAASAKGEQTKDVT
ncbi:hypothetical protein MACH01_11380 [Thalassospira tepidiphila]|nr:hypothetical protein MACH01_11380 [Thalassospira tepidiphila]